MFLFKNTKNKINRIGKNMTVYGLAGGCLCLILGMFFPFFYTIMVLCSVSFLAGAILTVVGFFVELSSLVKSAPAETNTTIPRPNTNTKTFGLYSEGDHHEGCRIELHFKEDGKIMLVHTGWWPFSAGASNAGQDTREWASDYFITHSIDEFVTDLSNYYKKDFSELKNREDMIMLFEKPLFKMLDKDGVLHNFIHTGHTRYSPNRSSTCGYGSDDWFYLCEKDEKHFLLLFTDNAEYGVAWACAELLPGDYENLLPEDVNYWGKLFYSKERTKVYGFHLTDIDAIRHLLPTQSRCFGKLTDEAFYGI